MLILSRKLGEGVVIGDSVYVRVISIDKGSVKLGFEAPSHTLILRSELKEAVALENKKASKDVSDSLLAGIGKELGKID
ncbi:carbon storage regulator [Helicobacter ailurogastricus]|uniref:Translational regulator CsrA n=1 Tax=Helicobacter ailurogastricus TaxID=1578720 RepID=A0A0K2X2G9_9HELI|nr:carbon storage regulator [Helicobacter ailurogastricus]CRF40465.1 Carbon storage regulator [Helicobacter ailurogastricus]CRF43438.1 Carbon storage regulator [Helicobacter ailurogastricus]CRF43991.1 Carbon storage regulator [Helicobacter ailurogastricus]CRF52520.1 Carbon storage regulator [Helicobacter ailurogastricus]BDQ29658.1 carbon storage regulator [Helicobacter ailurogastricus]